MRHNIGHSSIYIQILKVKQNYIGVGTKWKTVFWGSAPIYSAAFKKRKVFSFFFSFFPLENEDILQDF